MCDFEQDKSGKFIWTRREGSAHINLHIQAFHPHHPKDSLLYITAQGGLKKGMYIALRQPCGGGGDWVNPVKHLSYQ